MGFVVYGEEVGVDIEGSEFLGFLFVWVIKIYQFQLVYKFMYRLVLYLRKKL